MRAKRDGDKPGLPPILEEKRHQEPSVFAPENLLREARRQKRLPLAAIPEICILDPDGDMVRHLLGQGRARPEPGWACYHTELHAFTHEGSRFGIVGCAVGGPFAVLVAEQMFASGCRLLLSMTSAGQIAPLRAPPYFVIIDRALRDEGTSYHYLPPGAYSIADPDLISLAGAALAAARVPVAVGATWTTDAPFRETAAAVERAKESGILAVEMEAASLYAFASACGRQVLCLAHVTNQMAQIEGDFEKGAAAGAEDSLEILSLIARRWLGQRRSGS